MLYMILNIFTAKPKLLLLTTTRKQKTEYPNANAIDSKIKIPKHGSFWVGLDFCRKKL